jgi:hypothetical protein
LGWQGLADYQPSFFDYAREKHKASEEALKPFAIFTPLSAAREGFWCRLWA